jgi:hypothetical protein
VLDAVAVGVLSAIENTIEYITGDSATFKNGKMIAMTRQQVIASRNQDRQKKMQALQEPKSVSPLAGVPSVYKLPFPIPSAPGIEPITPVPTAILSAPPPPPSLEKRTTTTREEPKVITVPPVNEPPKPPPPPPRPIVFGGTSAIKDDDDKKADDEIRYEDVEESP